MEPFYILFYKLFSSITDKSPCSTNYFSRVGTAHQNLHVVGNAQRPSGTPVAGARETPKFARRETLPPVAYGGKPACSAGSLATSLRLMRAGLTTPRGRGKPQRERRSDWE